MCWEQTIADRYRVTNLTRSAELASVAERANNPVTRGIGLMFRKGLPPGGGLILDPCRGVVSFFMRFPIDVIFLTRDNRVAYVLSHMKPWKVSRIIRQARFVVELPSGMAAATGTSEGDVLSIEAASD